MVVELPAAAAVMVDYTEIAAVVIDHTEIAVAVADHTNPAAVAVAAAERMDFAVIAPCTDSEQLVFAAVERLAFEKVVSQALVRIDLMARLWR